MALAITIIIIYFLPSILGYKRKNKMAIFLLNLLLGWTVLGWIIALIWASMQD